MVVASGPGRERIELSTGYSTLYKQSDGSTPASFRGEDRGFPEILALPER
jgi:hypothetical protein